MREANRKIVGTVVGGVVGTIVAGPAGTYLGAALGQGLGIVLSDSLANTIGDWIGQGISGFFQEVIPGAAEKRVEELRLKSELDQGAVVAKACIKAMATSLARHAGGHDKKLIEYWVKALLKATEHDRAYPLVFPSAAQWAQAGADWETQVLASTDDLLSLEIRLWADVKSFLLHAHEKPNFNLSLPDGLTLDESVLDRLRDPLLQSMKQAFARIVAEDPVARDQANYILLQFCASSLQAQGKVLEDMRRETEQISRTLDDLVKNGKIEVAVAGLTGEDEPALLRAIQDRLDKLPKEVVQELREQLGDRILPEKKILFNLPSVPNIFTGREEELLRLHGKLATPNTVALIQTAAIQGGGGIGKSTLAAAYATLYVEEYDAIVWLTMSSDERFLQDLSEFPAGGGMEEPSERTTAWLQEFPGKLLLILDNVEDPVVAEAFVKRVGPFRSIVTMRSPQVPTSFNVLHVDVLDPIPAAELLLKAANRIAPHGTLADAPEYEREAALRVVELLDRLPLMLDQAGVYADSQAWTIDEFERKWPDQKEHVLKTYPRIGTDVHDDVWAMTMLSFERLSKQNTIASLLTLFMAYLDPDRTTVEIFTYRASAWPKTIEEVLEHPGQRSEALQAMLRSALVIKRDAQFVQPRGIEIRPVFTMHRSTQEVLRAYPGIERESLMNSLCYGLVGLILATDNDASSEWPRLRRCLSAFLRFLELADAYGVQTSLVANLTGQVGYFSRIIGDFTAALNHYEKAEAIYRQTEGDNRTYIASMLNNAARVYEIQGALDKALTRYEEAERIDREVYGDEHPHVSIDVNNIGGIYQDRGDLDEALRRFEEAERIDRKHYGDDHPNVAIRVNNIGGVYQLRGDLDEALKRYLEAERIDRKHYGDDHPHVAMDTNNIGGVYQARGELDEALKRFEEAERIDRLVYGDDHPSVATDVNNIGGIYQSRGDLDEALKRFEEAEKIDRKAYGNDHPSVAIRMNNIAGIHLVRGDQFKALQMQGEALAMFLRAYGAKNRDTVTMALNVASIEGNPFHIAFQIGGEGMVRELTLGIQERLLALGLVSPKAEPA